MKALILAAGYATQLYPLTLDIPKPLLKIRKKPIIEYVVEKVEEIRDLEQILIVSNDKFYRQIDHWLNSRDENFLHNVKLINDGSKSIEDRLGAIGDINLVINKEEIKEDLLILASDNIFDFDLRKFIEFSLEKIPFHSICLYHANNHIDLTRFGIAQLNSDSEIFNFEEKPILPKSNLISTYIYFFPKEKLYLISQYLNSSNHSDTLGFYIRWLTQNDKVFGKICNGMWFDLGDFDALSQALIYLNTNGFKGISSQILTGK